MGKIWTTIPISPETKRLLEELKRRYGVSTYDELIKRLTTPPKAIAYDLSKEVPPSTAITWEDNYVEMPEHGSIQLAVLNFPPGCKGLVEVRLGVAKPTGIHWILPENGFLALDGMTLPIQVKYEVDRKDRLVAEIYNYDGRYPHKIGITVLVEHRP